jgi:hypothetical protein
VPLGTEWPEVFLLPRLVSLKACGAVRTHTCSVPSPQPLLQFALPNLNSCEVVRTQALLIWECRGQKEQGQYAMATLTGQ